MKKGTKIALAVLAALLVLGAAFYFTLTWLLADNRRNQPPDGGASASDTTNEPDRLVYTKDYVLQGDPGDGLSDTAAARALYNALCDNLKDMDIHITLIGLEDMPSGEAYLFAGPIDTTYAVVYGNGDLYYQSGRDGSWIRMSEKGVSILTAQQAESLLLDSIDELMQRMSANGKTALLARGEEQVNGEDAYLFDLGADTPEKFTAEYHFAVTKSGNVLVMDTLNGTDYIVYEGGTP